MSLLAYHSTMPGTPSVPDVRSLAVRGPRAVLVKSIHRYVKRCRVDAAQQFVERRIVLPQILPRQDAAAVVTVIAVRVEPELCALGPVLDYGVGTVVPCPQSPGHGFLVCRLDRLQRCVALQIAR